jgi:hypothetical protein
MTTRDRTGQRSHDDGTPRGAAFMSELSRLVIDLENAVIHMGKWMSVSAVQAYCGQQTWDNAFNADGWADEIYLRWDVQFYNKDGVLPGVPPSDSETKVYGDVNGFPQRIQAGSATRHGGIKSSDTVIFNQLLWSGYLSDDLSVVIRPAIWEWDGPLDIVNAWLSYLVDSRDKITPIVDQALTLAGAPGAASPRRIDMQGRRRTRRAGHSDVEHGADAFRSEPHGPR